MTAPPPESEPAPIRVLLPDGRQEVVGRLHARRQLPDGWVYFVAIPVYPNLDDGSVEPAEYRMRLRPQTHLRPVEETSYDAVPTERLEPPPAIEQLLGPRRPSEWVLARLGGGRGPTQAVVHAVDCADAPPTRPGSRSTRPSPPPSGPEYGSAPCAVRRLNSTPSCKGFDTGFHAASCASKCLSPYVAIRSAQEA
ncbi:hypothetical protein [Streptomyces sp. NPDC048266]|uniref:hypothetical protein n=1 Tax=Streptomyces sp. NPDC048266 TaxID=3155787 RepID=UPI0033FE9290